MHGFGRIVYDGLNSNYYEGNFENHRKNGFGVKVSTDGKIEMGIWAEDELV